MTLVAVPGEVLFPAPWAGYANDTPTVSSTLVDSATDAFAIVFQAPKTGTLNRMFFRLGAVTTAEAIQVSFQDLNNLNPDGTADQFRVIASGDVVANRFFQAAQLGVMTSDGTDTGTKRSVTVGDILALVVEPSTFVAAAWNVVSIGSAGQRSGNLLQFPHVRAKNSGTWAFSATAAPICVLEYSDGSYAWIGGGASPQDGSAAAATIRDDLALDEFGLRFQVPFQARLLGCWVRAGALNGVFDLKFYDDLSMTALTSKTIPATSFDSSQGDHYRLLLAAPQTLAINTTYYITLRATDSAASDTPQYYDVVDANFLDAAPGGKQMYSAERNNNAASWTTRTTRRPLMGLVLDRL